MRKMAIGLLVTLSALVSVPVWADADDDAWIAKCLKDNKKEGASAEIVTKYCTCMNGKMSDDEKKSISAWEQAHPKEMAACEAEAGWK
jgi:hypothetical protein